MSLNKRVSGTIPPMCEAKKSPPLLPHMTLIDEPFIHSFVNYIFFFYRIDVPHIDIDTGTTRTSIYEIIGEYVYNRNTVTTTPTLK